MMSALEATEAKLAEDEWVMIAERKAQYGSSFTGDQRACIEQMFRQRREGVKALAAALTPGRGLMSDTPLRVTTVGRNIYLDGGHLAAAVSKEAAFVIAFCLNTARSSENMPSFPYADTDEKRVQEFFA